MVVAGLSRVDVSGYRQHSVVGRVIGVEELLNVVDARRVQVFHRADRRMRVGPIAKDHLVHLEQRRPVSLIVVTEPFLFFDRFLLVL
jgi:hypothetical protein